MEQLKFANPVFRDGLNVTVRLGTKWDDLFWKGQDLHNDPKPVPIELALPDGTKIGGGQIEESWTAQFVTIPQAVLQLEHDGDCTNLSGLYNELKKVYGDQFTAGSIITVLFFTVNKQ